VGSRAAVATVKVITGVLLSLSFGTILTASVAACDGFWSSLTPVHAHCVLCSQALLRTYGNTMIMGTVSYPDSPCFALAARRGVITTTQHFTLLGVNTWRWPSGVPYSFDSSPEVSGTSCSILFPYKCMGFAESE
jgi:hypothetical protein